MNLFNLSDYIEKLNQIYEDNLCSNNYYSSVENSPVEAYYDLKKKKELFKKRIKALMESDDKVVDRFDLKLASYNIQIQEEIEVSINTLSNNNALYEINVDNDFINSLIAYTKKIGISEIGFSKVPQSIIFKNKKILYSNAIVCIQEMLSKEISQAPSKAAQYETMRVYVELNVLLNNLASWIRSNGIPAQVSYPYRGYTLYPMLAAEANLGYRGKSGLLISPKYGSRVRIGAIYVPIKNLSFVQENTHKWILEFCNKCKRCIRKCPANAILDTPIKNGNRFTCIDNEKCFPWLYYNNGCSICIKECPLS